MYFRTIISILFVCLPVICLSAVNEERIVRLDQQMDRLSLTPYIYWLEDSSNQLTSDDIMQEKKEVSFRPPLNQPLNFGYSSATYWVKIKLYSDKCSETTWWYIHLRYPLLNQVDCYIVQDSTIKHIQTGTKRPLSNRPLRHPDFVFPIKMPTNSEATLFLKVQSSSSIQLPMVLWKPSAFYSHEILLYLGTGCLYMFFLFIAVLNLVIFVSVRYRTCLTYAIFVISYVILHMSYKGLAIVWLWPQMSAWITISIPFFIALTALSTMLFTQNFLNTREKLLHFHTAFQVLNILCLFVLFLPFIAPYALSIRMSFIMILMSNILILFTILAALQRGISQSYFFLIAWLMVIMGVITYIMKTLGWLPSILIIEKSVEIGYFLCTGMLGVSLFDQFQKERRKQENIQKQAAIERKHHLNVQENTMQTLDQKAKDLHEIAINLSGQIDNLNLESDTVAGASEEMSANIETIASAVEELSVNIKSISTASDKMSQHNTSVASAIQELTAAMNQISGHAQNGSDIAAKVVAMANVAGQTMKSLGSAADQIGSVTEVIKKIAEKTDILAVNAAIEAASAGEAGKGFAVVANEITKFSEQSARAAEDIATRIAGVQDQTQKAITVISEMQEVIESMNQSSESISQAVEQQTMALHDISDNASQANIQSDEMAHMMSEMSLVSDDVSKNAIEASKGVNDVAKSIRTLNLSGQELLNICQKIEMESQNLRIGPEDIKKAPFK